MQVNDAVGPRPPPRHPLTKAFGKADHQVFDPTHLDPVTSEKVGGASEVGKSGGTGQYGVSEATGGCVSLLHCLLVTAIAVP